MPSNTKWGDCSNDTKPTQEDAASRHRTAEGHWQTPDGARSRRTAGADAARGHPCRTRAASGVSRPRGNRRHCPEAHGEPAVGPDQHPGARRGATHRAKSQRIHGLREIPAEHRLHQRRTGLQPSVFPRRRQRREQQPLRSVAQRRHLPRRAADHDDPGRARHSRLRRGTHRGPRGAARDLVRREFAGRHDPHHHQPARPGRLRGQLWRRGQLRPGWRPRLSLRGIRQHPGVVRGRCAPRRLGTARRRLHRQRRRHAHVPDFRDLHVERLPDS